MVNAGTIDTSEQAPHEQCGYCHEYDGNSIMPDYPKLAGQRKNYLVKQLLDFKKGKRKGLMQATAELLTEQDIQAVATYFSQQTLNSANQNTLLEEYSEANNLYTKGDDARGLVACASCHLIMSDRAVPKLQGQHEIYIATQLISFKTGQRSNDQDNVMRNIAKKLTFPEIRQMAKYLSGLEPPKSDISPLHRKSKKLIKSGEKQ